MLKASVSSGRSPQLEHQLEHCLIGNCLYLYEDGTEEELDVVAGISDVGTTWGTYQRFTELGKHLSMHHSMTSCFHPNDWGISSKPPDIYAARFQESLLVYFGLMDATRGLPSHQTDALEISEKRCCAYFPPLRPANYYPTIEFEEDSPTTPSERRDSPSIPLSLPPQMQASQTNNDTNPNPNPNPNHNCRQYRPQSSRHRIPPRNSSPGMFPKPEPEPEIYWKIYLLTSK